MATKPPIVDNSGKLAEMASTDTVRPQNLATGTRDNTKFLRDDGTWQPTTDYSNAFLFMGG